MIGENSVMMKSMKSIGPIALAVARLLGRLAPFDFLSIRLIDTNAKAKFWCESVE